ncbi:hypothetical protein [Sphingobacterium sp. 1.A.5]|uniref:hypothetical protein n=1 Tax=Sphingobacterium sp. 1.A.5 TaxID=2044604 RepID=UPI000C0BF6AA|nr:hypothetical protein [Sphingobacterium sp. 1.A.5]
MANVTGWIKLHRSLLDWEWYKDLNTRSLFLHLLIRANHKENKFQGNTIKRGQILTGINSLSFETSLSIQKLRTSLNKLKSTNDITIESTNKNSIITIVNYDFYQSIDDSQQAEQQTDNNQSTNKQQTNNKRITTNKNIKKVKNIKNDKNEEEVSFLSEPSSEEKKDFNDFSTFSPKNIQEEIPGKNEFEKFGKAEFRQILLDLEVDPQHVEDWIKVRTAKRAGFTATALQLIFNECTKHNFPISEAIKMCAGKSWQGFKYEWYLNETGNGKQPTNTTSQSRQQRVDEVAEFRRANQQSIIERLQKYTAGNNQ